MAILPYIFLALLLLTFVLLAQQAGKFVEILGSEDVSLDTVADIALGLIPNILIFTLPMSVLIGTATGLSRLAGDSELIALRAAGVGVWRFFSPVLLAGIFFTFLTLYVAFEVAPKATTLMRQAALRVTLSKIESPIQPNTFNTEMPGMVIYVREGDQERGRWSRVFIYWQEKNRELRLITAKTGRLDNTGEQTELVLTDAVVTTLPGERDTQSQFPFSVNASQIVTDSSGQFRIRLSTGRNALLQKFREKGTEGDELPWREVLNKIQVSEGAERQKLQTSLHRKLALCCAPLAFALLGAGLGGRTKRVGRGRAVGLSIGAMLIYYLILLGGEHLSRNGAILPQIGSWLATGVALVFGLLAVLLNGQRLTKWQFTRKHILSNSVYHRTNKGTKHRFALPGYLDRSLFRAMSLNFVLAYFTLLGIFLIFTLFELLRFITNTEWGTVLLYLLYLVPLATMSLAPISLLIAVLITYALLAKRNEIIVWWSSGQSLYRLSLPTIVFSLVVSIGLWTLQENILPQANRKQEAYRSQIRGGLNRAMTSTGFQWLSVPEVNRLYLYKFDERLQTILYPIVYEFDSEGVHLKRLIRSERAKWNGFGGLEFEASELIDLNRSDAGRITRINHLELIENTSPESFKPMLNKPLELSSRDLSKYIKTLKHVRPDDITFWTMALHRRNADLATPIILSIIGIPFGVMFGRRSAFWTLGAAVTIGLMFWASASSFQQLGNYRLLPTLLAAWATPLIFITLGLTLFSRART
jgi:lipopolysaccharide export LptBFGC system permease protein LptF